MSNVAAKLTHERRPRLCGPTRTWFQRTIFHGVTSRFPPAWQGCLAFRSSISREGNHQKGSMAVLGQGKQTLQNDYMLFAAIFNGTGPIYRRLFGRDSKRPHLFWFTSTRYPQLDPHQPFKINPGEIQIDTITTTMRHRVRHNAT